MSKMLGPTAIILQAGMRQRVIGIRDALGVAALANSKCQRLFVQV
jgi:hypothetical protein